MKCVEYNADFTMISTKCCIHTVVPPDGRTRFFLDDCLLSRLDRTTDSHLERTISTNCCMRTVVPPDDGHRYARNM
jgi:hypothetical protein